MNTNEVLQLIQTLTQTGYKHIDVTHEGSHILLSNADVQGTKASVQAVAPVQVAQAPVINPVVHAPKSVSLPFETAPVAQAESVHMEAAPVVEQKGHIVESPIVGTFYEASGPDEAAFVSVGSKVSKGDVLCIIEAMKLMNEIEADADGEIAEILVDNEAGVEYGQPLFRIV